MPCASLYIVCTLYIMLGLAMQRDEMRPSPISAITKLLDMEWSCKYFALQHWRRVCTCHSHVPLPVSLARLMLFPADALFTLSLSQSLRPRTSKKPPPEFSAPSERGPSHLETAPAGPPSAPSEWPLCSRSPQHYQADVQAPVACDWRAA